MYKNKWLEITDPILDIKTKQNMFFNKNKILLWLHGHDVQIGGSPTGGGPYLTFLTGKLLLWLNFLSAGRSFCCSYIPQTAGGRRAQWCLPTDKAPNARWTLQITVFWESATILQLFAPKNQMQLVKQDVPWILPLTFSMVSLGLSSWVISFCQGLLQKPASLCLLGG